MDLRMQAATCPSCGLINDPSARFCRNCGLPLGWPNDPVRGTTTRRADLPSDRGSGTTAIVGLLAAVGLLVGAGYLAFRPAGTGGIAVGSESPNPSGSPALSFAPLPSSGQSGFPSLEPSALPSSVETIAPSSEPSPTPGATFTGTTGYTCAPASLVDPTKGRWRFTEATWTTPGRFDELTIRLLREGNTNKGTKVTIESMPRADVTRRYGLAAPAFGNRAIVVSFDGPTRIRAPVGATPNLQALESVAVQMDSTGVMRAVLGVTGSGCFKLSTPTWLQAPASDTVDIVVDIRFQ